jgi:hypothetical protein
MFDQPDDRVTTLRISRTDGKAAEGLSHGNGAGRTVAELAVRFRVSEDKIRRWIVSGELKGTNTASTLAGKGINGLHWLPQVQVAERTAKPYRRVQAGQGFTFSR